MKYSDNEIFKALPSLVKGALLYRPTQRRMFVGKGPLIKLAGGAIRDILHGASVKDYDLWVNCPNLYAELRNLFKDYPQIQEANLSYCSERNSVSSYDCGGFGVDIILYNIYEEHLIKTFDYPLNCHELFVERLDSGAPQLTMNSHPEWNEEQQFHLRSDEWLCLGLDGSSTYHPPERDVLRQKYLSEKYPNYTFRLY